MSAQQTYIEITGNLIVHHEVKNHPVRPAPVAQSFGSAVEAEVVAWIGRGGSNIYPVYK